MDEDQFQHHCKMSICAIETVRSMTNDEFVEWVMDEASEPDLFNQQSLYLILADTCAELLRRSGIKPRFSVKASALEPDRALANGSEG